MLPEGPYRIPSVGETVLFMPKRSKVRRPAVVIGHHENGALDLAWFTGEANRPVQTITHVQHDDSPEPRWETWVNLNCIRELVTV